MLLLELCLKFEKNINFFDFQKIKIGKTHIIWYNIINTASYYLQHI